VNVEYRYPDPEAIFFSEPALCTVRSLSLNQCPYHWEKILKCYLRFFYYYVYNMNAYFSNFSLGSQTLSRIWSNTHPDTTAGTFLDRLAFYAPRLQSESGSGRAKGKLIMLCQLGNIKCFYIKEFLPILLKTPWCWQQRARAQGHSCPALAVAFNYTETFLATSDHSGLIIVWKRWWNFYIHFFTPWLLYWSYITNEYDHCCTLWLNLHLWSL